MNRLRAVWTKLWGSYSIGLAVLIVTLVLAILTPNFLRPDNLLNVLANASIVGIVGLGMTLAIAAGMFDLSVGSTAAFAGCITLSLVPDYGLLPSVLAGLASGAVIGLCNGLIITELRVPAFIATMAMMTIVRGAALIFTDGRDIYLFGYPDYKVLTRRVFDTVPMPVILVLVILVILILMINHTRFGRHILAVGSNLTATKRAGVRTSLVIWGVFAIVGITAALTGLIVSAQVLTANARLNFGLELAAIATVVIGGTALTGGRANLIGTLLGSLLVAIINNGLNLLNVPIFYQQLTVGLLLLGALALSVRQGFSPTAYMRRQA
ncbi:MAG: ABC transporter permease [Anaerolineae bacterium]|jgi:ribose transport system permease protein